MLSLSIINPSEIKDPGINVDSQYRFEEEELFEPNKIKWIFYGKSYEYITLENGNTEWKYGFNHALGHIESIDFPSVKYDVIHGMLIDRIESNLDDYITDSDTDTKKENNTEYKLKKNKLKKKNFEECEIYVDENNNMDFESNYNSEKIKYKFIGNPTNKFHKSGFNYAEGILIPIANFNIKFRLKNGNITKLEETL